MRIFTIGTSTRRHREDPHRPERLIRKQTLEFDTPHDPHIRNSPPLDRKARVRTRRSHRLEVNPRASPVRYAYPESISAGTRIACQHGEVHHGEEQVVAVIGRHIGGGKRSGVLEFRAGKNRREEADQPAIPHRRNVAREGGSFVCLSTLDLKSQSNYRLTYFY